MLDGIAYKLNANDGSNSLHGGARGFDKRVWRAIVDSAHNSLILTYVSAAGEEGFPGTLTARVTYRLREDDSLSIEHKATTTAPTPVNLANHSYFNLTAEPTRSIVHAGGHYARSNG